MTVVIDSKHKDMPKTSPPALVINENGATLGERRLHRISPNLNDGASAWIHSVDVQAIYAETRDSRLRSPGQARGLPRRLFRVDLAGSLDKGGSSGTEPVAGGASSFARQSRARSVLKGAQIVLQLR